MKCKVCEKHKENIREYSKLYRQRLYVKEKTKKYFKEYNFHKLYKELSNFCSQELSAFYFDIRKDALYCDEKESSKRKACIKLLNILLDVLLTWFAPIISFNTKKITVIHDSLFWDYPENYSFLWRKYFISLIYLGIDSKTQITNNK